MTTPPQDDLMTQSRYIQEFANKQKRKNFFTRFLSTKMQKIKTYLFSAAHLPYRPMASPVPQVLPYPPQPIPYSQPYDLQQPIPIMPTVPNGQQMRPQSMMVPQQYGMQPPVSQQQQQRPMSMPPDGMGNGVGGGLNVQFVPVCR